jgi:hypothetical protein
MGGAKRGAIRGRHCDENHLIIMHISELGDISPTSPSSNSGLSSSPTDSDSIASEDSIYDF